MDDFEVVHIVGRDGICRLSIDGQGHLPCIEHAAPVPHPAATDPSDGGAL